MKSIKKEDRDESVEESSVRNNNTQQQIQPRRSIPIRRKSRKKFEESKRVHAISIRIPRSEIPQNLLLQKISIVD